jgi:hypothetical protein
MSTLPCRLLSVMALVALADFLFLHGGNTSILFHDVGVTIPLFLLAVATVVTATAPRIGERHQYVTAGLPLGLALLPSLETANALTFCVAAAGLVFLTLQLNQKLDGDIFAKIRAVRAFIVRLPLRLAIDAAQWGMLCGRGGRKPATRNRFTVWVMPVVLAACFLWLFAEANPVLEKLINDFDVTDFLDRADAQRIAVWLGITAACWPFIRLRIRNRLAGHRPSATRTDHAKTWHEDYFGGAAIVRALCLFNIIFAVQTLMDTTYLWGKAALPNGMTLAEYAHRGAYTLIVTALLAAGFVLFATQSGRTGGESGTIRRLVLLWTFQNVLLVASSVYRLDLYVEAYALTYWRIASFIWMVLVFTGLALIFAKIALGRSNAWLMSRNLMATGIVLYGAACTNFPHLIAEFNIRAAQAGTTLRLDTLYLSTLGHGALTAIDDYRARRDGDGRQPRRPVFHQDDEQLEFLRYCIVQEFRRKPQGWRQWSFRLTRMRRYLASSTMDAPALPDVCSVPMQGGRH